MASPPPPSSAPEKPPLPPNMFLSEDDLFSNECRNPNYDTGFQTAPSSPPHPNVSEDSSPAHKESTIEISSPPSPKLLQLSNLGPFPVPLQGRDAVPSHHLLKFENFSLLSKSSIEKYSSEFEAGGYKWNLSIYPTGDKIKDGEGHISIYLEMVDTSSLRAGWEVNAIFNFFVFDQIRDKYVGHQDVTVRRFHCLKTQWGIVKFIDLEVFNDPSNGYLVNDSCSFGVEVFIVKTTIRAERLSMTDNPATHKISWTFLRVSKTNSPYKTEQFVAGDYKWRIVFYPNGDNMEGKRNNNNITVALDLDTSTLPFGTKLFVHYTFRMINRDEHKHVEGSDRKLISSTARGTQDLMSQAKFKDLENGFVVDDKCTIETVLKVLGVVTLE